MKKFLSVLILSLVAVLCFAFAACDNAEEGGATTFTVSFNTYGGTAVQSQSIEDGATATVPTAEVKRAGYIFDGWDYDFTTPRYRRYNGKRCVKTRFRQHG